MTASRRFQVTGLAVVALALLAMPAPTLAQWWNPFARPAEPEPAKTGRAPNDIAAPPLAAAPPVAGPAAKQNLPAGAAPGYLAGATPPPANNNAAAGPPPLDPVSRMERLEAQMRTLTGQIEQLNYQLGQLRDEMRLIQASTSPPAGQKNDRIADAAAANAGRRGETPPAGADPIGAAIAGAPARNLAPPPPAATDGPINLAALANGGVPVPAGGAAPAAGTQQAIVAPAVKTASARGDYDAAYQHILAGEYADAEKGLRAFLVAYPDDKLAADAEYWLGDSLFERSLYRDAAEEFVIGYKAFPKSAKAPDTLLKLGLSLRGLGERDAACQTYAKLLKDYPTITNAMAQRVRQEQKNATC